MGQNAQRLRSSRSRGEIGVIGVDFMNSVKIKIEDVESLVTESEKNIQINDIPEEKFELVWEHLRMGYSGYEVFFCFNSERMQPNQKVPVEFLDKINANRIDDMLNFKLSEDDFTPTENELEIAMLTGEGFSEFATFHDNRNPDMFWTSARLKKRLDIWQILTLKKSGRLIGYTMTMITTRNTEIFVIESEDELTFKALLSTTSQHAFAVGKKEILYMVDRGAPEHHQQIAKDLGFRNTGFYQGFQVFL